MGRNVHVFPLLLCLYLFDLWLSDHYSTTVTPEVRAQCGWTQLGIRFLPCSPPVFRTWGKAGPVLGQSAVRWLGAGMEVTPFEECYF